jgi:hypothetical protein
VTAIPTSYLSQTGRKAASKGLALLTAAGLYFGGGPLVVAMTRPSFTAEERAALVAVDEGGGRRLRHPALGFSLLHPGAGFVPSVSQAFRADAHFYAFDNLALRERLVVGVFKGKGESSASLRSLLESMRQELAQGDVKGFAGKPSLVTPVEGSLRAVALSAPMNAGYELHARAYGLDVPGRSPFAVFIGISTTAPGAYAELLSSFRP